ncbi:MAG: DUF2202 domain-containing protein [Campylobacterota bacterium]|nr:DUF2202 domain-containing protein [Campylobacterota bacterium]
MKSFKLSLGISIVTTLLLVGCGDSSNSNTTKESTYTDVTVERGPVIGAYVVDNNGVRAYNLGEGQYRFQSTPSYPITAYGGYIDVNRDGTIDNNDTALNIPLSLNEQSRTKLTLLTTIAQNDELKEQLMSIYDISEEELYSQTPSTSLKISVLSDVLFKHCIENNITTDSIDNQALQTLQTEVDLLLVYSESIDASIEEIATQNEINLINDLNITLNDVNITAIQNEITQSTTYQQQNTSVMLDSFPNAELTQEDKDGLIFMYQEEKVARDVYLAMYDIWNIRIFSNIASAEQTHMDSVKAILEKYELEVPVLSDTRGVFDLEELQELYNTLIVMGKVSSNEALKVGVLVEETDIADLIERMEDAPDDIKTVYQSLLNGSYNHLNAFNKQVR